MLISIYVGDWVISLIYARDPICYLPVSLRNSRLLSINNSCLRMVVLIRLRGSTVFKDE